MAEVYRPVYTVTDPTTGKKRRRKSRTYHVRYYTPDGKRQRVKGFKDRKATEALATELERRAPRLAAGLADPMDEHAKRPLAEHAADFGRYLAAKGNTADYVAKIGFRLSAVLDGCRFVRVAELQPSAVVEFLAALRRDGKSVKTANDYLAAIKGFTRWLARDRRIGADPMLGLGKLANADTDLRHARRDFAPDELARLLDAARQSPLSIRRLSGTDRHFLYLTACATGFRASELASMTPESFDLDCDTPTSTVQAAHTKNRKEAVQPLPRDVAEALRGYLSERPVGKPVWPGKWKSRASLLIRADLRAARRAWLAAAQDASERAEREQSDFLAYRDAEGRYGDFHALRHSFITMVGKMGVSPKEHQDLARHSTYALTSRYTHARFYDLAAAVQALPIPAAAATLAATGTDGRSLSAEKNLSPNLSPSGAILADFSGQRRTEIGAGQEAKNPGKQAVLAAFQGSRQEGRKVEDRGFEPLTS